MKQDMVDSNQIAIHNLLNMPERFNHFKDQKKPRNQQGYGSNNSRPGILNNVQTHLTFAISTPETDSSILTLSSVVSRMKQCKTSPRPAFSHKSISSGNANPVFHFSPKLEDAFSGCTLITQFHYENIPTRH